MTQPLSPAAEAIGAMTKPLSKGKLYIVMRAVSWSAIEVNGYPLPRPLYGPQRFIPVFDTQEEAIAWADDGDRVAPISALEDQ